MRGRIPLHAGSGPGLSQRRLGAKGGAEKVTVTVNQLPSHTHQFNAVTEAGADTSPTGDTYAPVTAGNPYRTPSASPALPFVNMNTAAAQQAGGSRSHTNLMPYLCMGMIWHLRRLYT